VAEAENGKSENDNGKKSNHEFVATIVAIVAGTLASALGIVATYASSRDAQRTAREAQREAARAARERSDLTELRSVLDRALADLTALDHTRVNLMATSPPPSLAAVDDVFRAAEASHARLVIRLGRKAEASRHFGEAMEAYQRAASPLVVEGASPSTARKRLRVSDKYKAKGDDAETEFIEAAQKLVGSQLPE
jgi:hypothetical protein